MSKEEKKKKPILLSPKNELAKDLDNTEFVKNPFIYSQVRGDFTPLQTELMVEVAACLQDRIGDWLTQEQDQRQMSLFTQEEMNTGPIKFCIPLKSIGLKPTQYQQLFETCEKIISVQSPYIQIDEVTGEERIGKMNIFSKFDMPTSAETKTGEKMKFASGRRRTGELNLYMTPEGVKNLFDMRHGYVEHLRRIAKICRCRLTPRLYIYLSRWKNTPKHCKSVDFLELKEFLGMLEWDSHREKIKNEKHKKFAQFKSRVLDPIQEDLKSLAENNQVDFWFEYEVLYSRNQTKGNPKEIKFVLFFSQMGLNRRDRQAQITDNRNYAVILREEYNMSEADINMLLEGLTDEMMPEFEKEVLQMREKIEKYKPRSITAYVRQSLKTAVKNIKQKYAIQDAEIVEEVKEKREEAQPAEPILTEEDKESWNLFMELAKDAIDEHNYNTFLKFCELYGFDGETVIVQAPTSFVIEMLTPLVPALGDAFKAAFGDCSKVRFRVDPNYR